MQSHEQPLKKTSNFSLPSPPCVGCSFVRASADTRRPNLPSFSSSEATSHRAKLWIGASKCFDGDCHIACAERTSDESWTGRSNGNAARSRFTSCCVWKPGHEVGGASEAGRPRSTPAIDDAVAATLRPHEGLPRSPTRRLRHDDAERSTSRPPETDIGESVACADTYPRPVTAPKRGWRALPNQSLAITYGSPEGLPHAPLCGSVWGT